MPVRRHTDGRKAPELSRTAADTAKRMEKTPGRIKEPDLSRSRIRDRDPTIRHSNGTGNPIQRRRFVFDAANLNGWRTRYTSMLELLQMTFRTVRDDRDPRAVYNRYGVGQAAAA